MCAMNKTCVCRPMSLHPRSPERFFLKAINAEVRFQCDEDGRCTGLVFRQNGEDLLFS